MHSPNCANCAKSFVTRGSVEGEFVWMVDGVDYATTWVELRAMWGRGQASTLEALRNFFHPSLKLESKERTPGMPGPLKRVYGKAQTPLARVLASAQVSAKTKHHLKQEKARLNPFALQRLVTQGLKEIAAIRQLRP